MQTIHNYTLTFNLLNDMTVFLSHSPPSDSTWSSKSSVVNTHKSL